VIKPLGALFQGAAGVSGASLLGNGRVALVLDVEALLRVAGARHDVQRTTTSQEGPCSEARS
jgi:two-component system chemotaxis sensor kinase CheA